jgi:F0F1-type ATP synthase gamma subunit
MSLNQLKQKINTYQSTQKVTKAMRNISAVKMQKIKHAVLNIKSHLVKLNQDFPKFFSQIKLSSTATSQPKIIVIFGPKKGLCGGLGRRVFVEALERNLLDKNENTVLIVAELPTSKNIAESGHKIDYCFDSLDEELIPTLPVLKTVFNYQKPIVKIFFPKINHHVLEFELKEFNLDNELDNTQNQLCIFGELEHAFYESRLCEEEKRVEAMTYASDNCEKIKLSSKLKYFKLRQQKITQEILEISN